VATACAAQPGGAQHRGIQRKVVFGGDAGDAAAGRSFMIGASGQEV
jgi:hypothetical protein